MVDLGAEPESATAVEEEEAGEPAGAAPEAPRHAAAPLDDDRGSGPPTRARLAIIAAIGIAVVLIVAFALSAFAGNSGDAAAGSTPSASASTPAPSSSLTPTEQLCLHLQDVQLLRVDNYTRLAAELADDEAAIQASGDAKLAADVDRMRTAVIAYKDALAAQADMTAVTAQMGKAYSAMPCA
jgi:hypothetical protein